MDKKKVLVGMSGGVDSSVAAALLLKQGYEVIGVTMQIWPDKGEERVFTEGGCCSLSAVDDARRVASKLGIPYYVLNFKEVFDKIVIENFIDEYLKGRTPNPCIMCNKFIKFEHLLNKALSLGAEYVATGHYAKVEFDEASERYLLKKSDAGKKDQTYFLYTYTQSQLAHTLLPLSQMTKTEVRKIAEELELPVAHKAESQDICFVDEGKHGDFIEKRFKEKNIVLKNRAKGNFIDKTGSILGPHRGIYNYTIGQRKGLGLSLNKRGYVVGIDDKNNVVIGDNEDLFSNTLIAEDINLISIDKLVDKKNVKAKIRYAATEADALIEPLPDGKIKVIFSEAQRAITPGQSVVFYDGDVVLGGGIIANN